MRDKKVRAFAPLQTPTDLMRHHKGNLLLEAKYALSQELKKMLKLSRQPVL